MRRIAAQFAILAFATLGLAGCSAYQASRSERDDGYQPDGTYVLTEAERAQNCTALQGWIRGYGDSVRKLALARATEAADAPRSIWSGLTRLSGTRESTETTQTMCRQYAIMIAMNRELQNRRCDTVDIDGILAAPEAVQTAAADNSTSRQAWGVAQAPTLAEYQSASASAVCGGR